MDSGSSASDDDVIQLKIVVLGDSGVGKTSLIRYFCDGQGFRPEYKQTMGLDYYSKRLQLPDCSSDIILQILDVGGQQLGGNMLKSYIHGSAAVVLVYDVTNPASFKKLEDWGAAVVMAFASSPYARPKVTLVGNKSDLSNAQVSPDAQRRFVDEHHIDLSFFVSAKSGERVNALFTSIAADLVGVAVKKDDLELMGQVTATMERPSRASQRAMVTPPVRASRSSNDDCVIM